MSHSNDTTNSNLNRAAPNKFDMRPTTTTIVWVRDRERRHESRLYAYYIDVVYIEFMWHAYNALQCMCLRALWQTNIEWMICLTLIRFLYWHRNEKKVSAACVCMSVCVDSYQPMPTTMCYQFSFILYDYYSSELTIARIRHIDVLILYILRAIVVTAVLCIVGIGIPTNKQTDIMNPAQLPVSVCMRMHVWLVCWCFQLTATFTRFTFCTKQIPNDWTSDTDIERMIQLESWTSCSRFVMETFFYHLHGIVFTRYR